MKRSWRTNVGVKISMRMDLDDKKKTHGVSTGGITPAGSLCRRYHLERHSLENP